MFSLVEDLAGFDCVLACFCRLTDLYITKFLKQLSTYLFLCEKCNRTRTLNFWGLKFTVCQSKNCFILHLCRPFDSETRPDQTQSVDSLISYPSIDQCPPALSVISPFSAMPGKLTDLYITKFLKQLSTYLFLCEKCNRTRTQNFWGLKFTVCQSKNCFDTTSLSSIRLRDET